MDFCRGKAAKTNYLNISVGLRFCGHVELTKSIHTLTAVCFNEGGNVHTLQFSRVELMGNSNILVYGEKVNICIHLLMKSVKLFDFCLAVELRILCYCVVFMQIDN